MKPIPKANLPFTIISHSERQRRNDDALRIGRSSGIKPKNSAEKEREAKKTEQKAAKKASREPIRSGKSKATQNVQAPIEKTEPRMRPDPGWVKIGPQGEKIHFDPAKAAAVAASFIENTNDEPEGDGVVKVQYIFLPPPKANQKVILSDGRIRHAHSEGQAERILKAHGGKGLIVPVDTPEEPPRLGEIVVENGQKALRNGLALLQSDKVESVTMTRGVVLTLLVTYESKHHTWQHAIKRQWYANEDAARKGAAKALEKELCDDFTIDPTLERETVIQQDKAPKADEYKRKKQAAWVYTHNPKNGQWQARARNDRCSFSRG